ncbi:MAG: hypothetical protein JNK37_10335 [Verrucomicrobiales bacterium]|nr:hypothetical protein [Verrucomicrobiales bacterium]
MVKALEEKGNPPIVASTGCLCRVGSSRAAGFGHGLFGWGGFVTTRGGFPAVVARFPLAATIRIAALPRFTTGRRVAAGFSHTTRLGSPVRLFGGCVKGEAGCNADESHSGKDSMDQFHGIFDGCGLFEFGL